MAMTIESYWVDRLCMFIRPALVGATTKITSKLPEKSEAMPVKGNHQNHVQACMQIKHCNNTQEKANLLGLKLFTKTKMKKRECIFSGQQFPLIIGVSLLTGKYKQINLLFGKNNTAELGIDDFRSRPASVTRYFVYGI